ncbi:MAG: YihY/virulence factor BrkB family protein, partial [Mycobacteriaceae bacterium]|nr:YihY/virulence factor BrkB family protein [Mycobacteriaceae bacterium]
GYYPLLFAVLVITVTILYRVSLPEPLPSHRLILGSVLATVVFLLATFGLRVYLTWITSTGYTYGALATPIAFLLFAFFLGFAVVIGAELNNAIQEEFPAAAPHARRLRWWLRARAEEIVTDEPVTETNGDFTKKKAETEGYSVDTNDKTAASERVSPS